MSRPVEDNNNLMNAISQRMEIIDEEVEKRQKAHDLSVIESLSDNVLDLSHAAHHQRNKSQILKTFPQISVDCEDTQPSLKKIKEAPFEAKNKDMSIDLDTMQSEEKSAKI